MKAPLIISFSFCLCLPQFSHSQSNQNFPLFKEKDLMFEKYLNGGDYGTHTSIRPFISSHELEDINNSILISMRKLSDTLMPVSSTTKSGSNGNLSLTGIFDTYVGYERTTASKSIVQPAGGLLLEVTLKEKLSLSSTFLSGNSAFPSYVDTFISKTDVVPGLGSAYTSKTGDSYQYAAGYLSYSPNKIFNFQAGKDKNFYGDGYRSLFLSDVANSYPFLKISITVWKLKYVSLFTWMKDVTAPSHLQKDRLNKYGTFHYLSWNASKRFNLSVFESIIWQGSDSNRVRNYDINYLNPVIFFRPVEYSLGSSDNACLGVSFKIKVGRRYRQQFYGQVILDEFLLSEITARNGWWANKQGVQFGFKNFDLFKIKNLVFQTEINAVRPYTYSHGSVQQNYAHYGQPLAHPLGANFAESVTFLNYRCKKWMFGSEFLYAKHGKDVKTTNYGGNIFLSYNTRPNDYNNHFFQGIETDLRYAKFRIGYYLIPSADLLAEAGVTLRQETNSASSLNSTFLFIGLRTGIFNQYNDF